MGDLTDLYIELVKNGTIPDYWNMGIETDTPYIPPKPYIQKEPKHYDTTTN